MLNILRFLFIGFLMVGVIQPNLFPDLWVGSAVQSLTTGNLAEETEEDSSGNKKPLDDLKVFRNRAAFVFLDDGIIDPGKFEIAFYVTGYHRFLIDEPPEC